MGASELQSKRREFPVNLEEWPAPALEGVPAHEWPTPVTDGLPGAQVKRALEAAYRYLNKRERTAAEVRRSLRREGFSAETIAQTLALLREEGTVDDQRFAQLFTEDKRELNQWGSGRIRRALIARGVDPETVAAVLDLDDPEPGALETERERALTLLRRRFPEPPRSRRDRDRALGVLLRKGFEPELAVEMLSAYGRD